MPFLRKKGLFESNKVQYLPVDSISPNPNQPRQDLRSCPTALPGMVSYNRCPFAGESAAAGN